MTIDTSIYSNIQQPQTASPIDAMQKAMSLKQMMMQQQAAQYQMQQQMAIRQAYANNTDQNGQLNQQGIQSDVAKMGYGQASQGLGEQFSQQQKAQGEAQAAQADAALKTLTVTGPAFEHLAGMTEDQRKAAWPQIIQQLKSQGVNTASMDHPYDPQLFQQYYANWQQSKPSLESQHLQAQTAEARANAGMVPLKKQAEQFGSRSPNAELSSQFSKDAAPVKSSQMAMQQMFDNYHNRSPQGDASLILNAYKIKFPNAPDVNSLEELSKSQSVPDQWRQAISHRVNGLFDQSTVDNLMRDAASTYSGNVTSLRGMQKQYADKAKRQGVNPEDVTALPAVDKTFSDVTELKKKLGPYVPPSERGGLMAGINKFVSNIAGVGGNQTANAAAPDPRDAKALDMLKSMDASDPKAFQLRAILKSKGLLK